MIRTGGDGGGITNWPRAPPAASASSSCSSGRCILVGLPTQRLLQRCRLLWWLLLLLLPLLLLRFGMST
jgi:hypothetical protein